MDGWTNITISQLLPERLEELESVKFWNGLAKEVCPACVMHVCGSTWWENGHALGDVIPRAAGFGPPPSLRVTTAAFKRPMFPTATLSHTFPLPTTQRSCTRCTHSSSTASRLICGIACRLSSPRANSGRKVRVQ